MGPVKWRRGQSPFSLSALPDGEDLPEGFSANYVYPRENDTVVGGTSYHNHLSEVRPRVLDLLVVGAEKILGKRINRAKIKSKVADRPYREGGIRMEPETIDLPSNRNVLLVHNYGHGGAGFTTAAGTAYYSARFAKEQLN
jgi:glycine/D-amino acid oxidase-like deaminating enzyme